MLKIVFISTFTKLVLSMVIKLYKSTSEASGSAKYRGGHRFFSEFKIEAEKFVSDIYNFNMNKKPNQIKRI